MKSRTNSSEEKVDVNGGEIKDGGDVKVKVGNLEAIDKLQSIINSTFGENTFYMPKKVNPVFDLDRISTGNLFLDMDLGGGFAIGRVHLVTGPFSSGKTYLALKVAAEFTKRKKMVCIIDAEATFDPKWAEACGVDMDYLFIVKKQIQEEIIDLVELIIASGEFQLIILDSMAALIPKKLKDEQADKAEMGKSAYLNNRMFRKMLAQQTEVALEGKEPTTVIVINQWRKKVNAIGNPNILPGGEGQYYYCSTWVDFWAEETILDSKDSVVGMKFGYHVRKNKTAPPRRQGQVAMFLQDYMGMQKGDWDVFGAIIDLAKLSGVFKVSGSWYNSPVLDKSYQFTNLWKLLYSNEEVEKKVLQAIFERFPDIKFNYMPYKRKLKLLDKVDNDEIAEVG